MAKKGGRAKGNAPATLSDVDELLRRILNQWKPVRGGKRGRQLLLGVKAMRDLNQVLCRLAADGDGDEEFAQSGPRRPRRRYQ